MSPGKGTLQQCRSGAGPDRVYCRHQPIWIGDAGSSYTEHEGSSSFFPKHGEDVCLAGFTYVLFSEMFIRIRTGDNTVDPEGVVLSEPYRKC